MCNMDKYEYYESDEIVEDGAEWLQQTLRLISSPCVGAVSSDSFTARKIIRAVKLLFKYPLV